MIRADKIVNDYKISLKLKNGMKTIITKQSNSKVLGLFEKHFIKV